MQQARAGHVHAGTVAQVLAVDAYAATAREDFLGPGPWQMFRGPGLYTPTPSNYPVYLYTDALFGIVPARGINNGQPSLMLDIDEEGADLSMTYAILIWQASPYACGLTSVGTHPTIATV